MSEDACEAMRESMVAAMRGRLDDDARTTLDAHLALCPACRHAFDAERELDEAFARALPLERASSSLRDRIAKLRSTAEAGRAARPARGDDREVEAEQPVGTKTRAVVRDGRPPFSLARRFGIGIAFAAAACALIYAGYRIPRSDARVEDPFVAEAVNDHLRVLYAAEPLEVKSGGVHQVKPWFDGKLDFAPMLQFGGDDDFPLEGGAIGVFFDRKAAVFAWKRRLHPIDLFVFRAEGLPWPAANGPTLGTSRSTHATARGFHVIVWKDGELGYALVSDVDENDLGRLAAKIAGN